MNIFQRILRFFSFKKSPVVERSPSVPSSPYDFFEKKFNTIPSIGNSLQFVIGKECIYINGKGDANSLSRTRQKADAIIVIPKAVFNKTIEQEKTFDFLQNSDISFEGNIGLIIKVQTILNAK